MSTFQVLIRGLSGETEECHEEPQNSWFPCWDLSPGFAEYEAAICPRSPMFWMQSSPKLRPICFRDRRRKSRRRRSREICPWTSVQIWRVVYIKKKKYIETHEKFTTTTLNRQRNDNLKRRHFLLIYKWVIWTIIYNVQKHTWRTTDESPKMN